jgi:hypothetical protein
MVQQIAKERAEHGEVGLPVRGELRSLRSRYHSFNGATGLHVRSKTSNSYCCARPATESFRKPTVDVYRPVAALNSLIARAYRGRMSEAGHALLVDSIEILSADDNAPGFRLTSS